MALPFHVLIVRKLLKYRTVQEAAIYFELLEEAEIPTGHEELLNAILEIQGNLVMLRVKIEAANANILEQRRIAEEKAAKKAASEKPVEKNAPYPL